MKNLYRILIIVLIYLLILISFSGCNEVKLINNNLIDPTGEWSSSRIICGNEDVIVNYSFEENKYSLSRYVAGILEYEEKGSWQIKRNGLFTFIPTVCKSKDGTSGNLKEISTQVKYTAVCFEDTFDYFYWNSNSEHINIHIKRQPF